MDTISFIQGLEAYYTLLGYPFIFLSAAVESSPFGWLMPGGAILSGAGFFSFRGTLRLANVVFAATLGTWCMLILAYALGARSGDYFIKKLRQQKNAKRASRLLKNHGGVILSTSLMANATRFWVSYVAGMNNYSLIKFSLYSLGASLTWSSLWSVLGYLAGTERVTLEKSLLRLGILAWLPLLIVFAIIYWSGKREYEEYSDDND